MVGLLSYAAAGAVSGLGKGLVEQAEAERERALEELRRQDRAREREQDREWQLADRAQGRAWNIQDRDEGRAWDQSRIDARASDYQAVFGNSNDMGGVLAQLEAQGVGPGNPNIRDDFREHIPGIFSGESRGDYDALFGFSNRPGGRYENVRLTDMTVAEALEFSNTRGEYAQWVAGQVGHVATPMGAYQVVGSTLGAAVEGLGLTGNERMTPELQDEIGQWIYDNQGIRAWVGYDPRATQAYRLIADPETPAAVRETLMDDVTGAAEQRAAAVRAEAERAEAIRQEERQWQVEDRDAGLARKDDEAQTQAAQEAEKRRLRLVDEELERLRTIPTNRDRPTAELMSEANRIADERLGVSEMPRDRADLVIGGVYKHPTTGQRLLWNGSNFNVMGQ